MTDTYQTNTKVQWNWGEGTAEGYIRQIFRQKVSCTLQGAEVTRNGTADNPAYLIEQQDGAKVLKLQSEISQSAG